MHVPDKFARKFFLNYNHKKFGDNQEELEIIQKSGLWSTKEGNCPIEYLINVWNAGLSFVLPSNSGYTNFLRDQWIMYKESTNTLSIGGNIARQSERNRRDGFAQRVV